MRSAAQFVAAVLIALFGASLLFPVAMAAAVPTGSSPHVGCGHARPHPAAVPPSPAKPSPASLNCCVSGHNAARPVAAFSSPVLGEIAIAVRVPRSTSARAIVLARPPQRLASAPLLLPLRI